MPQRKEEHQRQKELAASQTHWHEIKRKEEEKRKIQLKEQEKQLIQRQELAETIVKNNREKQVKLTCFVF